MLHGVAIYHVQRANLYVVRAYGRYVRKLREESTGAHSAVRVFRFQGIMSVLAINSGHAKGKIYDKFGYLLWRKISLFFNIKICGWQELSGQEYLVGEAHGYSGCK